MVSHVVPGMHVFASRHDISGNRIGPEKGVIALATGSVLNAIWDMFARSRGKPLWQLGAFIAARCALLEVLTCSLGGSSTQSATSRRKSSSKLPHSVTLPMPSRKMRLLRSFASGSQAKRSAPSRSFNRAIRHIQPCVGIPFALIASSGLLTPCVIQLSPTERRM